MDADKKYDSIYSEPHAGVDDFSFDEKVAGVFPDMIRRSVPGYGLILNMLRVFAVRFVREDSKCYDMGCSLGAATLALSHGIDRARTRLNARRNVRIVAVDNSLAMVRRCRDNINAHAVVPVDLICADVRDVKVKNASLAVFNFTLQFVPPEDRFALLSVVAEGLLPGGALALSEKISFPDPEAQKIHDSLHQKFKQINGYSDLEISQKRAALEKVLIPDDLETHVRRLKEAGFSRVEPWFQCFNFASILAVK